MIGVSVSESARVWNKNKRKRLFIGLLFECEDCGVKVIRNGSQQIRCKGCAKKAAHLNRKKWSVTVLWNLVGERITGRLDKCERCMERPSRVNFSFCRKCSVCTKCRKNKPKARSWECKVCSELKLAFDRAKTLKKKRKRRCRLEGCNNWIPRQKRSIKLFCSADCQVANERGLKPKVARECALEGCSSIIPVTSVRNKRFCSKYCVGRSKSGPKLVKTIRKCKGLGCNEFIPKTARPYKIYCSPACNNRVYRARKKMGRAPE